MRIFKILKTVLPTDFVLIKKKGGSYVLIHQTIWLGKVSKEEEFPIKDLLEKSTGGFVRVA